MPAFLVAKAMTRAITVARCVVAPGGVLIPVTRTIMAFTMAVLVKREQDTQIDGDPAPDMTGLGR